MKLFKKDKIVEIDDLWINCSKQPASIFLLRYGNTQFTLSVGTYSIDEFKIKIDKSFLKQINGYIKVQLDIESDM